jgi:hypothetical protein
MSLPKIPSHSRHEDGRFQPNNLARSGPLALRPSNKTTNTGVSHA